MGLNKEYTVKNNKKLILAILLIFVVLIGLLKLKMSDFDKYKNDIKVSNVSMKQLASSVSDAKTVKSFDKITYDIRYVLEGKTDEINTKRTLVILATLKEEDLKYASWNLKEEENIKSRIIDGGKTLELIIENVETNKENVTQVVLSVTGAPNDYVFSPIVKVNESTNEEKDVVTNANSKVSTLSISGIARDSETNEILNSIELAICKVENENTCNKIKTVFTKDDGSYVFGDLENGTYKIEPVNNENYKIDNNYIQINNESKKFDLNIINSGEFNAKITKYVKKIVLNENGSEKVYDYDNLNKVALSVKKLDNVSAKITYEFKIVNTGTKEGYAKVVKEDIPEGLTFNANYDENKDWIFSDGKLYNKTLSSKKLKVGEEKTLTITLDLKDQKEAKTYLNKVLLTGEVYHTVVFVSDDEIFNEQEVLDSDIVKKVSSPSKENYKFEGWYLDKKGENEFDFNTRIEKDMVIYAKWSKIQSNDDHTLTFKHFNEETSEYEVFDTKIIPYGGTPEIPDRIPEKKFNEFVSWVDENGDEIDPDEPIFEDKTYYSTFKEIALVDISHLPVEWTRNNVTVTMTIPDTITRVDKDGVEYQENIIKENYDIEYVIDDGNEYIKYSKPFIVEENCSLKARLSKKKTNEKGNTTDHLVTNIDKINPKIIQMTTSNLKQTSFSLNMKVQDNESGVGTIKIFKDGSLTGTLIYEDLTQQEANEVIEDVYEFNDLNSSTTYTIYIELYDRVGNFVTSDEMEVTTKDTNKYVARIIELDNEDLEEQDYLYYTYLEDAIDYCASTHCTIQMIDNTEESNTISDSQDIILDLNGFVVSSNEAYTIENNGNFTVIDNSEEKDPETGMILNTSSVGIENKGVLTLGENGPDVSVTKPIIKGTTAGIKTVSTLNFYDGIVSGHLAINGKVTSTPDHYGANVQTKEDIKEATLVHLADPEARIDGIYYMKLQEAVDEAKIVEDDSSRDTIVVLKNVTLDTTLINKENSNFILDLNGNNISTKEDFVGFINSGKTEIIDSSSMNEEDSLPLDTTGSITSINANAIENNNSLKIKGGKYYSNKKYGVVNNRELYIENSSLGQSGDSLLTNSNSNTTINSANLVGAYYNKGGTVLVENANFSEINNSSGNIHINNMTITGTNTNSGTMTIDNSESNKIDNDGTLTIENGTYKGDIFNRDKGTITINGGSFGNKEDDESSSAIYNYSSKDINMNGGIVDNYLSYINVLRKTFYLPSIVSKGKGNFNISNVTLNGNISSEKGVINVSSSNLESGYVILKGEEEEDYSEGTINLTGVTYNNSDFILRGGTLLVDGGTFNAGIRNIKSTGTDITLNDATINDITDEAYSGSNLTSNRSTISSITQSYDIEDASFKSKLTLNGSTVNSDVYWYGDIEYNSSESYGIYQGDIYKLMKSREIHINNSKIKRRMEIYADPSYTSSINIEGESTVSGVYARNADLVLGNKNTDFNENYPQIVNKSDYGIDIVGKTYFYDGKIFGGKGAYAGNFEETREGLNLISSRGTPIGGESELYVYYLGKNYVAQIGDDKYTSLKDAIDTVNNVVLKDKYEDSYFPNFVTSGTFGFDLVGNELISNSTSRTDESSAYLELDYTNYTEEDIIPISLDISTVGEYSSSDKSYAYITSSNAVPSTSDSSSRFASISGTKDYATYQTTVTGGSTYYLHIYFSNYSNEAKMHVRNLVLGKQPVTGPQNISVGKVPDEDHEIIPVTINLLCDIVATDNIVISNNQSIIINADKYKYSYTGDEPIINNNGILKLLGGTYETKNATPLAVLNNENATLILGSPDIEVSDVPTIKTISGGTAYSGNTGINNKGNLQFYNGHISNMRNPLKGNNPEKIRKRYVLNNENNSLSLIKAPQGVRAQYKDSVDQLQWKEFYTLQEAIDFEISQNQNHSNQRIDKPIIEITNDEYAYSDDGNITIPNDEAVKEFTLNLSSHNYTIDSNITVNGILNISNGTLIINEGKIINNGTLKMSGGSMTVKSSIGVENNGTYQINDFTINSDIKDITVIKNTRTLSIGNDDSDVDVSKPKIYGTVNNTGTVNLYDGLITGNPAYIGDDINIKTPDDFAIKRTVDRETSYETIELESTSNYEILSDHSKYKTLEEALEYITRENLENETIKLISNRVFDGDQSSIEIPISIKNLTIDLNNKEIKTTADKLFIVNGTVTFTNGQITGTDISSLFENNGTLTITNGTYTITGENAKFLENNGTFNTRVGTTISSSDIAIKNNERGIINSNSTTYTGRVENLGNAKFNSDTVPVINNSKEMTVISSKGEELTNNKEATLTYSGDDYTITNSGIVNMTSGDAEIINNEDATFNISNANIDHSITNSGQMSITTGTFNTKITNVQPGTLTIEKGTFNDLSNGTASADPFITNSGKITINGGTYSSYAIHNITSNTDRNKKIERSAINNSGTLEVNDGTFRTSVIGNRGSSSSSTPTEIGNITSTGINNSGILNIEKINFQNRSYLSFTVRSSEGHMEDGKVVYTEKLLIDSICSRDIYNASNGQITFKNYTSSELKPTVFKDFQYSKVQKDTLGKKYYSIENDGTVNMNSGTLEAYNSIYSKNQFTADSSTINSKIEGRGFNISGSSITGDVNLSGDILDNPIYTTINNTTINGNIVNNDYYNVTLKGNSSVTGNITNNKEMTIEDATIIGNINNNGYDSKLTLGVDNDDVSVVTPEINGKIDCSTTGELYFYDGVVKNDNEPGIVVDSKKIFTKKDYKLKTDMDGSKYVSTIEYSPGIVYDIETNEIYLTFASAIQDLVSKGLQNHTLKFRNDLTDFTEQIQIPRDLNVTVDFDNYNISNSINNFIENNGTVVLKNTVFNSQSQNPVLNNNNMTFENITLNTLNKNTQAIINNGQFTIENSNITINSLTIGIVNNGEVNQNSGNIQGNNNTYGTISVKNNERATYNLKSGNIINYSYNITETISPSYELISNESIGIDNFGILNISGGKVDGRLNGIKEDTISDYTETGSFAEYSSYYGVKNNKSGTVLVTENALIETADLSYNGLSTREKSIFDDYSKNYALNNDGKVTITGGTVDSLYDETTSRADDLSISINNDGIIKNLYTKGSYYQIDGGTVNKFNIVGSITGESTYILNGGTITNFEAAENKDSSYKNVNCIISGATIGTLKTEYSRINNIKMTSGLIMTKLVANSVEEILVTGGSINKVELGQSNLTLGVNDQDVSPTTPEITGGISLSSSSYSTYTVNFYDGVIKGSVAIDDIARIVNIPDYYKLSRSVIDDYDTITLIADGDVQKVIVSGGINYTNLQDAVNAAPENDTTNMVLYADYTLESNIVVPSGKIINFYTNSFNFNKGEFSITGEGQFNILDGAVPEGLLASIKKLLNANDESNYSKNLILSMMDNGDNLSLINNYKLQIYKNNEYITLGVDELLEDVGRYVINENSKNYDMKPINGKIYLNNIGKGDYRLIDDNKNELIFKVEDNGNLVGNIKENYKNKSDILSSAEALVITSIQTGIIVRNLFLVFLILILVILSLVVVNKKIDKE